MATISWLHFSLLLASAFHVLNGAVTQLPDFWAVEETDVIFKWDTASPLKEIEWFFPMVGDTVLIYYDANMNKTDTNPAYQAAYAPEYGSAAMILFKVSTDNSSTYAVRVTTQSNTLEEDTTNLTVITKAKLLDELAITVNGRKVDFGINSIEAGDLVIELSSPSEYGTPFITCHDLSETPPKVLNCTKSSCEFKVNGTSPGDIITLNMTYPFLQVAQGFEFHVNGNTTPGLSAGEIVGIVIGVFCVCVIVIVVIIFLLKKKTR